MPLNSFERRQHLRMRSQSIRGSLARDWGRKAVCTALGLPRVRFLGTPKLPARASLSGLCGGCAVRRPSSRALLSTWIIFLCVKSNLCYILYQRTKIYCPPILVGFSVFGPPGIFRRFFARSQGFCAALSTPDASPPFPPVPGIQNFQHARSNARPAPYPAAVGRSRIYRAAYPPATRGVPWTRCV